MPAGYESSLLLNRVDAVVHGFFTRNGGVSTGDLSSLNCGLLPYDDLERSVFENRRRAMAALQLNNRRLIVPNLCHGNQSLVIDEHEINDAILNVDALITSRTDIALGITYADCLPILLTCEDGHLIIAIHAGWRGIQCGVIKNTLLHARKIFKTKRFLAAIGPAISPQSFVVTGEVADFFVREWPGFVAEDQSGIRVDLTAIAKAQLDDLDVKHCDKVGGYTDLDEKLYFSHRRDRGTTGRHIAIIARKFTR